MIPVRFVKGQSPYQAGETAGFPDEMAHRLVSAGVAVPIGSRDASPNPSSNSGSSSTPTVASLDRPPADKMVRRSSSRTKGKA